MDSVVPDQGGTKFKCVIWGYQSRHSECCELLRCGALWSGRSLPSFPRKLLPAAACQVTGVAGSSEKTVPLQQTTWCHIPYEVSLLVLDCGKYSARKMFRTNWEAFTLMWKKRFIRDNTNWMYFCWCISIVAKLRRRAGHIERM